MKVIIVEDEITASEQLEYLLKSIRPNVEIIQTLDSVKTCVQYLSLPHSAELIFMDIHLADGLSFEIFEHLQINIPIIFTTAYNAYTLRAFKVNSIDYLLKPIQKQELENAILKYESITKPNAFSAIDFQSIAQLMQNTPQEFKANYLVTHRDELLPIGVYDISYFYIDTGVVKLVTFANKSYVLDKTLDEIEQELDTKQFIRANRQYIINRKAVDRIKIYFGGKLIVKTSPTIKERIVISKAKAANFKSWLNS